MAHALGVALATSAVWVSSLGHTPARAQGPGATGGPRPAAAAAADGAEPAAVGEIRAASRAYVEALARGDGVKLASMWTADGDLIDDQGVVQNGRATVAAMQPQADGTEIPQLRIAVTAIRMVTPTVAMEDGSVEFQPAGGRPVQRGRFTATWVKQDDGWKLTSVRENRFESDAGTGGDLTDLDWMVGDWDVVDAAPATDPAPADAATASAGPAPRLRATVRWNSTHTFLIRELRLAEAPRGARADRPAGPDAGANDGGLIVSQRIGWDPASKQIRSWSFGEDGSHGEGVWNHEDGSWFVRTSSVLPDGSTTTAVNVYRFDGDDTCTWQSFPTHAGADAPAPVTATLVRRKAR
jgi:uncharacterized protein (TIGR02246 family)